MPVNDAAVGLGDNGDTESEFPDTRRHLPDLLVIFAGVPGVGNQTLHRPHFDNQIHFDNSEKSFQASPCHAETRGNTLNDFYGVQPDSPLCFLGAINVWRKKVQ